MKKISVMLLISLFIFGSNLHSQVSIQKATVTSFKNYPLNGVVIICKKSKQTVKTDSLGMFSIVVNKNEVLVIKAEGFKYFSTRIKDDSPLNINLLFEAGDKAYQSVLNNNYLSKSTLDYCIKNLMGENNNFDRMLNIYDIIQSIYPAAQFSTTGSEKKVVLESRGPNSLFSGNEALLVVDGIVTADISGISPAQVKSVKVLVGNDAADWGSRGANGVVEIELKSK